jgi:hypothetical protein
VHSDTDIEPTALYQAFSRQAGEGRPHDLYRLGGGAGRHPHRRSEKTSVGVLVADVREGEEASLNP